MKRTPLSRSRKRIPYRSPKREAITAERREFVWRVLHERQWCEAHRLLGEIAIVPGLRAQSTEVHELTRRSQGAPIVPSQGLTGDDVLALCHACHAFVTTNPAKAVELGLARWGMRENPTL